MDFFIVDLTGRHYHYQNVDEITTIRDVRSFMAPQLGLTDVSRVLLVHAGVKLEDDTATLVSLGFTPDSASSFRCHALVKFKAPEYLFDGEAHPVNINDICIGGAPLQPINFNYSIESYLTALKLPAEQYDSVHHIKESLKDPLLLLAETTHVDFPQCLISFLCGDGLAEYSQLHLSMSPLVINNHTIPWGAPPHVRISETQSALLFMMDQQGCCYWYAVWNHSVEGTLLESSSALSTVEEEEKVEVFVLFGGQEFELGSTVYLTSKSFWQFLTDYGSQSNP